jgi:serine/threonine protein kinase
VLLDNLNYTQAVDIWSTGVVLLEMLEGRGPPFYGQSEIEQLILIFKLRGKPDEKSLSRYEKYGQLHKIGLRLPNFKP